uniref:RNAse P Rpr2/Rpp21/SNM1 subunit domain-containing protein n=1 Tax=Panagrellus redivivus TaxID=6233 RepID=A0A7E4ZY13_PANRE
MADAADSPIVRNANALKKQFRSRMLALSFVPEAVKADISRELIDEADLRSDACRTCGSLFTATTSRVALCRQPNVDSIPKRNQKRKHRRSRAQLTVTCTRCSTTFDPVRLPRPRPSLKPVKTNALPGTEAPPVTTTVEKPKQQPVSSKKHRESKTPKGLVLPKLTSRELKGKKTNRLSKLVAAMESTESSTSSNPGSSLGAFLSSL